jgi:quinol monooxygenase YgiN
MLTGNRPSSSSGNTSILAEPFGAPRVLSAVNSDPKKRHLMKKSSYSPAELNDGFVVAITIEAKEGQADAVGAILGGLVAPTLAEPGVKLFIPYRSPTNPLLFFLFELYLGEDGWRAHQETEHFKAAIKELVPRAARRERIPFVPYTAV